jgi:hypothetical protein
MSHMPHHSRVTLKLYCSQYYLLLHLYYSGSQGSIVSMVTMIKKNWMVHSSNPARGKRFFSSLEHALQRPNQPPNDLVLGFFPGGKAAGE